MQSKTTRAFRTISEAAEELDLQPHVLRFWESKFPTFKPIKRGGGRRFYRPEDIEFLRGIKILLHDERHPIKDVQKLIKVKGSARVVELGRSIRKASIPKDVKDTVLVPDHIQGAVREDEDVVDTHAVLADSQPDEFASDSFFPDENTQAEPEIEAPAENPEDVPDYLPDYDAVATSEVQPEETFEAVQEQEPVIVAPSRSKPLLGSIHSIEAVPTGLTDKERTDLESALTRLKDLKRQWQSFKQDTAPQ